jgi:hypothetical protein
MQVIDEARYFFAVNRTRDKMRVYKQINLTDTSPCNNAVYNAITD